MIKREIWDFWARYGDSEQAFMQNKPNFPEDEMSASTCFIRNYENDMAPGLRQNKPNSKPNKPNQTRRSARGGPISQEPKMNVTVCPTGNYQNQPPMGNKSNQTQSHNPTPPNERQAIRVLGTSVRQASMLPALLCPVSIVGSLAYVGSDIACTTLVRTVGMDRLVEQRPAGNCFLFPAENGCACLGHLLQLLCLGLGNGTIGPPGLNGLIQKIKK
jgi:hypothetical protein